MQVLWSTKSNKTKFSFFFDRQETLSHTRTNKSMKERSIVLTTAVSLPVGADLWRGVWRTTHHISCRQHRPSPTVASLPHPSHHFTPNCPRATWPTHHTLVSPRSSPRLSAASDGQYRRQTASLSLTVCKQLRFRFVRRLPEDLLCFLSVQVTYGRNDAMGGWVYFERSAEHFTPPVGQCGSDLHTYTLLHSAAFSTRLPLLRQANRCVNMLTVLPSVTSKTALRPRDKRQLIISTPTQHLHSTALPSTAGTVVHGKGRQNIHNMLNSYIKWLLAWTEGKLHSHYARTGPPREGRARERWWRPQGTRGLHRLMRCLHLCESCSLLRGRSQVVGCLAVLVCTRKPISSHHEVSRAWHFTNVFSMYTSYSPLAWGTSYLHTDIKQSSLSSWTDCWLQSNF